MSRTPRVDAMKVSGVLEKHGYLLIRQSGSHRIYKNSEGIRITLPIHSGCVLRIDLNSLTAEIVHFDRQKLNITNAETEHSKC